MRTGEGELSMRFNRELMKNQWVGNSSPSGGNDNVRHSCVCESQCRGEGAPHRAWHQCQQTVGQPKRHWVGAQLITINEKMGGC